MKKRTTISLLSGIVALIGCASSWDKQLPGVAGFERAGDGKFLATVKVDGRPAGWFFTFRREGEVEIAGVEAVVTLKNTSFNGIDIIAQDPKRWKDATFRTKVLPGETSEVYKGPLSDFIEKWSLRINSNDEISAEMIITADLPALNVVMDARSMDAP